MAISISLRAESARRLTGTRAWIVAAVALLALVAAVVGVSLTPLFDARDIAVESGAHVPRSRIVELSGVSSGTNVLWLDEAAVERRLEAEPWIDRARVVAEFPSSIRISVIERTPVAVASDGVRASLMAGDGTSLGVADREPTLPVIRLAANGSVDGPVPGPVGAARALGAMSPALRDRVGRVLVRLDGTLEIRMESGPVVRYGTPSDVEAKARAISRMLAWAEAQGERILRLTVTSPRAPAAVLADRSAAA
ncbi:MAG TPA: FtsQ-type POTRA domain-containing protein [Actinomycetota bacterium]|nr:FtsQ-type POTRA domain-containing protein [Actinomycetota bacterium]